MAGSTARGAREHGPSSSGISTAPGARATAHAKVILFGEHAVVHGGPAIAFPVPALELTAIAEASNGPLVIDSSYYRGPLSEAPDPLAAPATAMTATLELLGADPSGLTVHIEGDIPAERGLGSSAAVAAAISGAVARFLGVELDPEQHFELVQAAERVAHGSPSGLDARAVTAPDPIWFQAGQATALPTRLGAALVIADTGITGNTRQAVADVRRLRDAEPDRVSRILGEIDAHTAAARSELANDDHGALGGRMREVHELLRELTVSSNDLDRLVEVARNAGAIGAKMTGGGRGGCIVAMVQDPGEAFGVAQALRAAGAVGVWTLPPREVAA